MHKRESDLLLLFYYHTYFQKESLFLFDITEKEWLGDFHALYPPKILLLGCNNDKSHTIQEEVKLQIVVFWIFAMGSPSSSCQCFQGNHHFLLQGGVQFQYFTPKN
jgi:hypothetical protein